MIGLDTNILVRLVVSDDPTQTRRARAFVAAHCTAESPGFINRIVLCELIWTLERRYKHDRREIAAEIGALLEGAELLVEGHEHIADALERYAVSKAGLVDVIIGVTNAAVGCSATATFDRKASRAEGFKAVP